MRLLDSNKLEILQKKSLKNSAKSDNCRKSIQQSKYLKTLLAKSQEKSNFKRQGSTKDIKISKKRIKKNLKAEEPTTAKKMRNRGKESLVDLELGINNCFKKLEGVLNYESSTSIQESKPKKTYSSKKRNTKNSKKKLKIFKVKEIPKKIYNATTIIPIEPQKEEKKIDLITNNEDQIVQSSQLWSTLDKCQNMYVISDKVSNFPPNQLLISPSASNNQLKLAPQGNIERPVSLKNKIQQLQGKKSTSKFPTSPVIIHLINLEEESLTNKSSFYPPKTFNKNNLRDTPSEFEEPPNKAIEEQEISVPSHVLEEEIRNEVEKGKVDSLNHYDFSNLINSEVLDSYDLLTANIQSLILTNIDRVAIQGERIKSSLPKKKEKCEIPEISTGPDTMSEVTLVDDLNSIENGSEKIYQTGNVIIDKEGGNSLSGASSSKISGFLNPNMGGIPSAFNSNMGDFSNIGEGFQNLEDLDFMGGDDDQSQLCTLKATTKQSGGLLQPGNTSDDDSGEVQQSLKSLEVDLIVGDGIEGQEFGPMVKRVALQMKGFKTFKSSITQKYANSGSNKIIHTSKYASNDQERQDLEVQRLGFSYFKDEEESKLSDSNDISEFQV